MICKFSTRLQRVLMFSREEAHRLQHDTIKPEHFMLGLIRENEGHAIELLKANHADLKQLRNSIEDSIKSDFNEKQEENELKISPYVSDIMKLCVLEARKMQSDTIGTLHLLLALLYLESNVKSQLSSIWGITYESIINQLTPQEHSSQDRPPRDFHQQDDDDEELLYSPDGEFIPVSESRPTAQEQKKNGTKTPYLDKFGTDITAIAASGAIDPVIGREVEIERLAQILSRRKKNNPILIGEPGVGKTAIVEGLAMRILEGNVPHTLTDKRLISLDMAEIVAGTKYRGQFEERMQNLIREIKANDDIILFIDEIHTIIGAGSSPGTMDAANLLKPGLARGEIQCIGATTINEYRKSIEKDSALERRFQKVMVTPSTVEETLQILHNIKDKYEAHHRVIYTDKAVEQCVKLADRYLADRQFPDKAIDVLDEAGSHIHVFTQQIPQYIKDQEALCKKLRQKENDAAKQSNYELAASYRDELQEEEEKLKQMKEEWKTKESHEHRIVDEEQVAQVVSMISGVPVNRMLQTETIRLKGMQNTLNQRVIDQQQAVDKLVKAIRRSRLGLKDPNRPIGTFMFLGPTGVGKTLLVKELAKYMFGSPDALIRIDMSEYMEKFTVSRLVGAPPGYVGYDEGGQLTEKVRRQPYSIVLLDEIEKAHPDVFNLLLQVMDEGRLTDGNGYTVDFRHCVIVMTSNVGSRQLREFGHGIGFKESLDTDNQQYADSVIRKALHKQFSPEFLNRLDEIVTFKPLTEDSIRNITDLELSGLTDRVHEKGYTLTVTDNVRRLIARKGFDSQFGARPLRRSIQSCLEDPLSELLIQNEPASGSIITADTDETNDNVTLVVTLPDNTAENITEVKH